MDSAPLPPHERTWRHPSELVATSHDVESGSPPRGIALAGCALAIVMIATMVVALTPRQNAATTTANSATTLPTSLLSDAEHTAVAAAESIRTGHLADITAIPHAIAIIPIAASTLSSSDGPNQVVLPDLDDRVTVLTDQFAYVVAWRDVTLIDAATDAVVVDVGGNVVARMTDGHLIMSHDLLVGAALSVD